MKLSYGESKRTYSVSTPQGSSFEFATRGDMFNFLRSWERVGNKREDLAILQLTQTPVTVSGE